MKYLISAITILVCFGSSTRAEPESKQIDFQLYEAAAEAGDIKMLDCIKKELSRTLRHNPQRL